MLFAPSVICCKMVTAWARIRINSNQRLWVSVRSDRLDRASGIDPRVR